MNKEKFTVVQSDDAVSVVEKVNKVLANHGLKFEGDKGSDGGEITFTLKATYLGPA